MNTSRISLAFVAALGLSGCWYSDSSASDSPATATGDTPVRYVICGIDDKACFVAARFAKFDDCESHKAWGEMLCDTQSDPGNMTCVAQPPAESLANSYCTK